MSQSCKSCKFPRTIRTIPNNGVITCVIGEMTKKYSNACMWISIQMLLLINGITKSVAELRREAGFPGHDNEMFDIDINGHYKSLERCADINDLKIEVYYWNFKNSEGFLGNVAWNIGDGKIRCPIVAFGLHFEPIIYCPEFGIEYKQDAESYVPKAHVIIESNESFEPLSTDERIRLEQIELARLENELSDLAMIIVHFNGDIALIMAGVEDETRTVNSIFVEIHKEESELKRLENESVNLNFLHDFVDNPREKENLETSIATIIEQIQTKKEEIHKIEYDLKEHLEKVSQMNHKIDKLSAEIKKKENEEKGLREQIERTKKGIKKAEDWSYEQARKIQREILIDETQKDIIDLKTIIQLAQEEQIDAHKDELAKRLKKLEEDLDRLKKNC